MVTDEQLREWQQALRDYNLHNSWMIPPNQPAQKLIEAAKILIPEFVTADECCEYANDIEVIREAIATGHWSESHFLDFMKTQEGVELAGDVKRLYDEALFSDYLKSQWIDDWDGFTFTPKPEPTPNRFFEGIDTSELYSMDTAPFQKGDRVVRLSILPGYHQRGEVAAVNKKEWRVFVVFDAGHESWEHIAMCVMEKEFDSESWTFYRNRPDTEIKS